MKVLIVDDEPLSRNELAYLLRQNPAITDIREAEGSADALQQLVKQPADLLFLDIELNEENGFSLANELQHLAQPPLVIFATAYDNFAVDAFNIDAVDYVLKPFEQERINQAVAKAIKRLNDHQTKVIPASDYPKVITTTQAEKTTVIQVVTILSAVVEANVLTIATSKGDYQSRETLSWLKQRLNPQQFLQIHRSAIVRISAIREIQPWFNHTYQVTLTNNQKLPVGRSFVKDLRTRLSM